MYFTLGKAPHNILLYWSEPHGYFDSLSHQTKAYFIEYLLL